MAPGLLDPAFSVTPALRTLMTSANAANVAALIQSFLPVTDRLPGLANQGAAINPAGSYPCYRITIPTLIVHALDDGTTPCRSPKSLRPRSRGPGS